MSNFSTRIGVLLCWLAVMTFSAAHTTSTETGASLALVSLVLTAALVMLYSHSRCIHSTFTSILFAALQFSSLFVFPHKSLPASSLLILFVQSGVSGVLAFRLTESITNTVTAHTQLLQIVRGRQLATMESAEAHLQQEISRARRHERPLTFLALTPTEFHPLSIDELLQQLHAILGKEYLFGGIADLLLKETKSHDQLIRVRETFLLQLPETTPEQARQLQSRLEETIRRKFNAEVQSRMVKFPEDERTLAGVLDRVNRQDRSEDCITKSAESTCLPNSRSGTRKSVDDVLDSVDHVEESLSV